MGARLSWKDAQGIEGVVDLGYAEIFVGRAVECVIRTDDPMVSRRHARIYFQDGRHIIEDLGSSNGIYVRDQRLPSHALNSGDEVRCGNLWVRYQSDGMSQYGQQPAFGGPPAPMGGPPQQFGGPPPMGGPPPYSGGPPPPMGGPPPYSGGPPPPMGGPPPPYGGPPMGGPTFGGPPPPMGGPPPPMGGPPPPMGGPPPPMGGPPPPMGGGGPPSMGGSPRSPSISAVGPVGPPPPLAGAAPPAGGAPAADAEELKRLQRRVDQLQSEIRMLRGGGDKALRMEELETKVSKLESEKLELQAQVKSTEGKMADEAGDLKVQRAGAVLRQADEVVNGLNDILSELRINLMAAEGEVEQWASSLPKASFELVRESLRSCRAQMETAKELMRQLRDAGR